MLDLYQRRLRGTAYALREVRPRAGCGRSAVRFDERRRETESGSRLRHRLIAKAAGSSYSLDLKATAPAADSIPTPGDQKVTPPPIP